MTDLPALVDVDGVCADFDRAILRESGYAAATGVLCSPNWDYIFDVPEPYKSKINTLAHDPEFWRHLPLIDGAQEGIEFIRGLSEVVFVTSPWYTCKGWYEARKAWLEEHFKINAHKQYIPTGSKHLVDGWTLIDDKPANCTGWRKSNREPLLFTQPHNSSMQGLTRVTWNDTQTIGSYWTMAELGM